MESRDVAPESRNPASQPLWARPDDATRQAQLDAMSRRATSLLVLAAVLFVAAAWFESAHPWLAYVKATAEAALVGGLADWFAVTALFRHPLGIPIPHTAIVATRKDRIGRVLGNFVQSHFLTRVVVEANLRAVRPAERAATWLSKPENARLVARHAATGLSHALKAVQDESVQRVLQDLVTARLRATRAGPVIGKALTVMLPDDRRQALFQAATKLTADAVRDNRELIRATVRAESPWWVPSAVDDRIYSRIVRAIEKLLADIERNPNHPARAAFDSAFRDFVDRLQHAPEAMARADAIKDAWLDEAALAESSAKLLEAAQRMLAEYASRPDDAPDGVVEQGLSELGASLLGNPALLDALDDVLIDVAVFAVEHYRQQIGDVVANTVANWEPQATSRRFELAVGRDLQFVRINGTLVGGLVGLALYSISRLWR